MPREKSAITDETFDETEFPNFLRYLSYHLSWKHHNLLRRVCYYAGTSFPQNFETLATEQNVLSTGTGEIDSMREKDFLLSSRPQKAKKTHQRISSSSSTKNQAVPRDYLNHGNLHLNRIRRAREDESIMKLRVEFQLEKATESTKEDQFRSHLVSQIARAIRVPRSSISNLKITSGTYVSFTLSAYNDANIIMDDRNVIEAADSLKTKIKSNQLRIQDLNGQLLMTAGGAYASIDESSDYSLVILVLLCITLLLLAILIFTIIYIARRNLQIPKRSSKRGNEAYRSVGFGRDSSQSIGKYSYDSGLWLGPGPEPNFSVPEAPLYRPPTNEQIASTPRPLTAVRTRLKRNWNVDERALSTIPDDFGRHFVTDEDPLK